MLSSVITLMLFVVDVQAATVVNTEEELREALSIGGDFVLGNDITITMSIYAEESFSLDMNGHDITFGTWGDVSTYIAALKYSTSVKIMDSVGGASFISENADVRGVLCLEVDKSEIIGVDIPEIRYYRGENSVTDSNIEYMECIENYHTLNMNFYGNVTVDEMYIEGGTYNFNPSNILHTGMTAVENDDGTYTVGYEWVRENNETQTMYFDNYLDEEGRYYYSASNTQYSSAKEMVLRIYYVAGNRYDYCYYTMIPVDEEGKLWCAEIDTAYKNAIGDISAKNGLSEYLRVIIPKEDESIIDHKGNISIREVVEELPSDVQEETTSPKQTETQIETQLETQTEKVPDVVIIETESEAIEQSNKVPKVPNEDLPYIIGVAVFGVIVVVSLMAVIIHKKKQESSL